MRILVKLGNVERIINCNYLEVIDLENMNSELINKNTICFVSNSYPTIIIEDIELREMNKIKDDLLINGYYDLRSYEVKVL